MGQQLAFPRALPFRPASARSQAFGSRGDATEEPRCSFGPVARRARRIRSAALSVQGAAGAFRDSVAAAARRRRIRRARAQAALPRGLTVIAAAATVLVLAIEVRELRAAPPVYRREEITPALDYFARHRLTTNALYVYYGAIPAFQSRRRDSISMASTSLGGCHRGNPAAYLAELDSLRGHARVWVLFAHELPALHERERITGYLGETGIARDSVITTGHDVDGTATRASLYLYDLSDPSRLGGHRPPRFAEPALDPRLRCAAEVS